MRRRWILLAIAGTLSAALAAAQSGSTDERLSSPQRAVDNFLKWQLPPTVDMEIASEAMSINPGMSPERR